MIQVQLPDDLFEELFEEIGYPVITIDDLPYNKEYIENKFVWRAMKKFWEKFPKREKIEHTNSGVFEYTFPRETTFSAVATFNQNEPYSTQITADPYINALRINFNAPPYAGMYGTRYSYGNENSYWYEKANLKGIRNIEGNFNYNVNYSLKKIHGYSAIDGRLIITWLDYSKDFNDIPFNKQDDVIRLAKGYLMKAFGSLILMQATDLPNNLDGEIIKTAGEEHITAVIDRWKAMPSVAVIRN